MARFVVGTLLLAAGAAALVYGLHAPQRTWAIIVGGLLVAAGAFAIFEAAIGWCAVRAIGLRTPM